MDVYGSLFDIILSYDKSTPNACADTITRKLVVLLSRKWMVWTHTD